MKTSIQYKLLYELFRTIGVNKMLDKEDADFDKLLESCRDKQKKPLKVPYKKMSGFDIETWNVDRTVCYVVRAAYKSGVLYTTSDRHEGFLVLSGEGTGSVGFVDGIRMILAEKQALGGFRKMKEFISACFCDGGSIETRMRKAKRKFLRIEMLAVRPEYQRQGYMRKMLEYTYRLAESRGVPVILDTDDRDKASRYEHLGMKLDRIRTCDDKFHMYDLIRENALPGR